MMGNDGGIMGNNREHWGNNGEQGVIMVEQWGTMTCNEIRIMSSKNGEEWGILGQ